MVGGPATMSLIWREQHIFPPKTTWETPMYNIGSWSYRKTEFRRFCEMKYYLLEKETHNKNEDITPFSEPPRAHWLSWSRGEEQGQTRHGVPRSSRRCKSHEGTALGKRGGKRSRAYAGCTSTVSRGTSRHAPSRSDEAPVNELTFTESERVASGCLPHAIGGN